MQQSLSTSGRPEQSQLPQGSGWKDYAAFLDFDGTLVGIRDHPDEVTVPDEVRQTVRRLVDRTGGAVAIVSGRALDDLVARAGALGAVLCGSHGLETLWPDGTRTAALAEARLLDDPHAMLSGFAERNGLLVERKPGAIALHYRNRPECEAPCREIAERAAANPDLRVMHGDMVSEVALRAVTKGTALEAMMERAPFRGRLPLMAGDDVTDEDGIVAAQALGGIGVALGDRPTDAKVRFGDRAGFLNWISVATKEG